MSAKRCKVKPKTCEADNMSECLELESLGSVYSTPLAKRPRLRVRPLTERLPLYTQHQQHWYADGNLFLQIGGVRFKIYGGHLATESPFFAALLHQRNRKQGSNAYDNQSQINQVLSTAERIYGGNLFFLDPENELSDAPSAEEFATLLTAMKSGVGFAYDRPTFQDVCGIWKSAVFYEMALYQTFCLRYFDEAFPDNWLKISVNPCSIEQAVEGVRISRRYSDNGMGSIFRPAFYDLARTPLLPSSAESTKQNKTTKAQTSDHRAQLKKLEADHMVTLLEVQKRLGAKWSDVFKVLENVSCTKYQKKCAQVKDIAALARPVCEAFPYDPIIGIRKIMNHESLPSVYCAEKISKIKASLKKEARTIWKEFGEWIQEDDRDMSMSESDSNSSSEEDSIS